MPGRILIITPDGSAVACAATNSPNNETAFYEFSTDNGQLIRTLAQVASNGTADVLWSNASGSVLIGAAARARWA